MSLERLVGAIPEAILVFDTFGRIRAANAMAGKLFGYERQELFAAELSMLIEGSLKRPNPVGRRRDGSPIALRISVSLLDADDEQLLLAVLLDDSARAARDEEQAQAS